jgi:hypothetical protein
MARFQYFTKSLETGLQQFYRLFSNHKFFISWQAIRIAPINTDLDKNDLASNFTSIKFS